MDIELLKEFLILARCLNFSNAADSLYMSQPVLSRHIQNLENHLGVALFSRDKHSVTLTDIGKIFVYDFLPAFNRDYPDIKINFIIEESGPFIKKGLKKIRLTLF